MLYKYAFTDFLAKNFLNYDEICSFRWCNSKGIIHVSQPLNKHKDDKELFNKKLQI